MGKMMRQNMYQIVPSWDEPMEDIAGNVGNNMDNTMMGAPMVQNMGHNMMGHNMDKTMMGAGMVQNMGANNKITGFNMFGFPMFGSPMMGQKSYTNMMGQKMQIETMPSQSFTRFF